MRQISMLGQVDECVTTTERMLVSFSNRSHLSGFGKICVGVFTVMLGLGIVPES